MQIMTWHGMTLRIVFFIFSIRVIPIICFSVYRGETPYDDKDGSCTPPTIHFFDFNNYLDEWDQ